MQPSAGKLALENGIVGSRVDDQVELLYEFLLAVSAKPKFCDGCFSPGLCSGTCF